jgi:hypothetical protein
MSAIVIFAGLGCGTLLAAAGLVAWNGCQQVPGLSQAVRVIRWLAGGLLLIGAVLAWQGEDSLSTPALRLMLMAAWVAPPEIHRRSRSSRGSLMLILPALVLAGAGLFWTIESAQTETNSLPATLAELTVITCGGLGARALGHALSEITASTPQVEWPSAVAYVLLTLLVSGTAMANLWQRGALWGGSTSEGGLAGAWLAWGAAWMGPRQRPRLRAVVVAVTALLLIVLAVRY